MRAHDVVLAAGTHRQPERRPARGELPQLAASVGASLGSECASVTPRLPASDGLKSSPHTGRSPITGRLATNALGANLTHSHNLTPQTWATAAPPARSPAPSSPLHSGYPTLRADADYCRFDPVQNGWWRCRYCTAYAK
jgi:hypothetical protein